ncbi:hypothetical protein ACFL0V_04545 [Nanoarchaeota archaeon]
MEENLGEQLQKAFTKIKDEMGFRSTFREIDEIFYIEDHVQQVKFVSSDFSRQLCHRMLETYLGWSNVLHGWVMPVPHSMFSVTEGQMFDDEQKKEMMKFMHEILEMKTRNHVVGVAKDKAEEAKLIDELVVYWAKTFKPKLLEYLKIVDEGWKKPE